MACRSKCLVSFKLMLGSIKCTIRFPMIRLHDSQLDCLYYHAVHIIMRPCALWFLKVHTCVWLLCVIRVMWLMTMWHDSCDVNYLCPLIVKFYYNVLHVHVCVQCLFFMWSMRRHDQIMGNHMSDRVGHQKQCVYRMFNVHDLRVKIDYKKPCVQ